MKRKESLVADFTQGNVSKQLVVFATPLFLSSMLQIVYNMVDMVIVGQKLGKVGLSAVSIGGDQVNFLTFFAMGFANAGQVLISQYIGAGEKKKLGRFVGTMATFLLALGVVLSILCLIFRRQILMLMNTPPEAFSEALSYNTVTMAGLVFIYGYNMISAILRGMGDSVRPFAFVGAAALINVVLDLLFVMSFGMGSMGAALATVISQSLSFFAGVIYIYKSRHRYGLELSPGDFIHVNRGMLSELVLLGIPMAIKSAAVSFSKLFVNSWINSYGVAVSAFAGIANKINSTSNMIANSFYTAASSMIGQNIGAEKFDRVTKIMLAVFRITAGAAALLTVLFLVFPRQIYGFFTTDEEVLAIGYTYLPIAILIFWGSCARSGMNALANGSGNYKVNFAMAVLDGIVLRIGLALLFGLGFGMKHIGFWLGDAIAGFTPFWVGLIFYFSGAWKKKAIKT